MQLNDGISAIVTGGASGLGLATVKALRETGAKVAIFDMNSDAGAAVAAETGAVFCQVNVTDDDSVAQGFVDARAAQGQERIFVNCAGIGSASKTAGRDKKTGEIGFSPIADYERTVAVNMTGTFRCVSRSAAGMMTLDPIDGERGAMIMTASVAAEDGQIGQVAYSASKAGIVGMTLPIARDLAREMIRINTILPGLFHTPLLASLPENVQAALGAQVPNPARLGQPEEYAALAIEMCRNGYFNGEDVRLDGAIRMSPR